MKTIQITLDDDLHKHAKTLATQKGSTLGNLVRTAVEEKVARETKKARKSGGRE